MVTAFGPFQVLPLLAHTAFGPDDQQRQKEESVGEGLWERWTRNVWDQRRGRLEASGPRLVGGPNPERWEPEGLGPEGWGAQNFVLFFPSSAPGKALGA